MQINEFFFHLKGHILEHSRSIKTRCCLALTSSSYLDALVVISFRLVASARVLFGASSKPISENTLCHENYIMYLR